MIVEYLLSPMLSLSTGIWYWITRSKPDQRDKEIVTVEGKGWEANMDLVLKEHKWEGDLLFLEVSENLCRSRNWSRY